MKLSFEYKEEVLGLSDFNQFAIGDKNNPSCLVKSRLTFFLRGLKASDKICHLSLDLPLFYFRSITVSTCQAHSTPLLQSTALHILFWGI